MMRAELHEETIMDREHKREAEKKTRQEMTMRSGEAGVSGG